MVGPGHVRTSGRRYRAMGHGRLRTRPRRSRQARPRRSLGLLRQVTTALRWQVVAEPAGRGYEVRHARSHHVETRLDHGRVETLLAVGRTALAREPFDLAAPGDRLARVRPVPELIADQVRHLALAPTSATYTQDRPWARRRQ